VLLGDDAGNVLAARNAASTHDHSHDGVTASHATDDVKGGLGLAHHREIATGHIPQIQAHMGTRPGRASDVKSAVFKKSGWSWGLTGYRRRGEIIWEIVEYFIGVALAGLMPEHGPANA
jgi:hypothetical protein